VGFCGVMQRWWRCWAMRGTAATIGVTETKHWPPRTGTWSCAGSWSRLAMSMLWLILMVRSAAQWRVCFSFYDFCKSWMLLQCIMQRIYLPVKYRRKLAGYGHVLTQNCVIFLYTCMILQIVMKQMLALKHLALGLHYSWFMKDVSYT
jgi:hypothetical protein